MTTLHAHISIESADCDGRYSRSYIETMNETELSDKEAAIALGIALGKEGAVNDFSDLDFKARVLGNRVSYHEHSKVFISPEGFEVQMPTDEGYSHSEVRWCTDNCDETRSTYRDHTAEAAGY